MIKNTKINGLSATIYIPKKFNKIIILSHGFLLNKDGPEELFKELSKELYDINYFVIRYNFRINNNNKEQVQNFVLNDYLQDIEKIIEYCKKYDKEIILAGHSLGGLVSLIETNRNDIIKKLILLSPPIKMKIPKISTLRKFTKNTSIIKLIIRFLLSGFKINLKKYYEKLKVRTLLIYGTKDQFENYKGLKNIKNGNLKLIKIKDMDHFYKSYKKDIIREVIKFLE